MSATPTSRQHLIDPEICIRCNTCEETCPIDAITHDSRNYVVDPGICDACNRASRLPDRRHRQLAAGAGPNVHDRASSSRGTRCRRAACRWRRADDPAGGRAITAARPRRARVAPPPWSAAHPYVNLYGSRGPGVATVSGNHRLTGDGASSDIRHIVLDFGRPRSRCSRADDRHRAAGHRRAGPPHHVRLYSVASPRDGERPRYNNVALTVKRVTEDHDGRPVRGVASNYLCDLAKGDTVNVVGPFGANFLMPNHPGRTS